MTEKVEIKINDATFEAPVVVGSEDERAIDIGNLRAKTGFVTIDPAFMNTASTKSAITFLDGEQGILRYRGYPIDQLAEQCEFIEVAYLLIFGELPNVAQLTRWRNLLTRHSLIHEDMKHFFDGFPSTAHPMAVLSAMVCSLSTYYPEEVDFANKEQLEITYARLISKIRTIAAFAYKKSIGQPFVYPRNDLRYCSNMLNMFFAVPCEPYMIDPVCAEALDLLFILHADHEQNASTSTVRLAGSTGANPYAAISAGVSALWGPAHGGANEAALNMLEEIQRNGGVDKIGDFIRQVKDKNSNVKLMGFGHRVYKNFDPRAKIIREMCHKVLAKMGRADNPLLELAMRLEEIALKDEYFVARKLYPNVDFYSGIIYSALNIPRSMFTVMFAIARTAGWVSHWQEMISDPGMKIGRPRQLYTGPKQRDYVAIAKR